MCLNDHHVYPSAKKSNFSVLEYYKRNENRKALAIPLSGEPSQKTSLASRKHVWKRSQRAKRFHFIILFLYFSVSPHGQNSFSRECESFCYGKKGTLLSRLTPPPYPFEQEMTYGPRRISSAFSFDDSLWLDLVLWLPEGIILYQNKNGISCGFGDLTPRIELVAHICNLNSTDMKVTW